MEYYTKEGPKKGCLLTWHPFLDHSPGFLFSVAPHKTGNCFYRSV